MSKVLKLDTAEEFGRVVQAALEQRVVVQPFGNYQLIVPNEWKPPKAPKVDTPDPPKSEPEPDQTSTSARSSNKEVG